MVDGWAAPRVSKAKTWKPMPDARHRSRYLASLRARTTSMAWNPDAEAGVAWVMTWGTVTSNATPPPFHADK